MKAISYALAGASVLALASVTTPALAAQAQTSAAPAPAEDATLGEIVVTARRKSESLQTVPQVVNAVTADTLQKLQITQFADVKNVVPGLEFSANVGGFSNDVAMRGVSFSSTTSADASVALYVNDVVSQANFVFSSLYDIGQIEVLRGPQGTTRGVSAPSGAITITTRRPDLSQFGGYINASVTDQQGRNVNGALNIPLIRDVLGVRIAGAVDQNSFDGVRSIYSRLRPSDTSTSLRATVSFEPNDTFNGTLTYQHLDKVLNNFVPVAGPGFGGAPALGLAATPAIDLDDRVGVQDLYNQTRFHFDSVSLRLDSRIFGQHLSYIGGYARQHYHNLEDRDTGQNLIGPTFAAETMLTQEYTSHELRLSSDPSPNRFFDYTAGVYYGWNATTDDSFNTLPANFLPPAFGSPAAPNVAAFDPRFQLPLVIPTPLSRQDISVFGSVTLHLGSKTELTGGLRHLWPRSSSRLAVTLGDGLTALPPGVPCSLANALPGASPGLCVIPTGGTVVASPPQRLFREEHTIYNVSLSHRLTNDFMVYGNVGTAFRLGYASIGVVNAGNDPVLAGLSVHPSEKSRAYEVGFKWSFLDRRGRLNAAIFRQKFRNLPIETSPVPYVANSGTGAPVVQTFAFVANPDAIVEGFDVDAAFQILPNWNISAQVSYSDGRATTPIPCNDSNFDGTPDAGQVNSVGAFPRGVLVALCPGGSVSDQAYWSGTVQSEYFHPVSDGVDAYVRGLLTYVPKNARATPATVIDNYGLLNLYAGVRAHDGAWDAGLFVKNAFNTTKITDLTAGQLNNFNSTLSSYPTLIHNSGYFQKALTPPREVGINVRYAFGSR